MTVRNYFDIWARTIDLTAVDEMPLPSRINENAHHWLG
jgi:hypothetical protein